jgi:hypothetical protein
MATAEAVVAERLIAVASLGRAAGDTSVRDVARIHFAARYEEQQNGEKSRYGAA